MTPLFRALIGLFLLLLLLAVGWQLATAGSKPDQGNDPGKGNTPAPGTGDPAARSGPPWQSSRQCQACHESVWSEWHGSHHQIAYLNPEVRKLSDDFRNKECQACHLPRPISITGYGERTLPRITRPDEGVGCLTCHLGANGEILGRNANPQVACRPVASKELVSVELCQSCHNQHQTTDQWRASSYARDKRHCNECHMEEVPRGDGRTGWGHAYPGCHDERMLKRAGRFEVRLDKDQGELVLTLRNVGAGHNFPTEERHRAVDMVYRFQAEDGSWSAWTRAFRFRQPYRDEVGENTQLPANQEKTVRVPMPDGATRAQGRLWYRLTPFCGDDDPLSTLLSEQEVTR